MLGLPGFSAGGGMAISPSSASSATGSTFGAFNFAPKSGVSPWLLLAAAGLALLILKR